MRLLLLLLLACAPASAAKFGAAGLQEFSEWLTGDQYQALFDAQFKAGNYPSVTHCKAQGSQVYYRAAFKKIPTSYFQFVARHGIDDERLKREGAGMKAQGFSAVSQQACRGSDGVNRNQVLWVRETPPRR